jgi:hypothetical protein
MPGAKHVGGAATEEIDTVTFLAHAAAVVRDHGFVPARSETERPTWREALQRLKENAHLDQADLHRAHQIKGWAASLKPRDPDGYRARMARCIASERLTTDELPLAASSIRTFNLHLYYEIRGRSDPRRQHRSAV